MGLKIDSDLRIYWSYDNVIIMKSHLLILNHLKRPQTWFEPKTISCHYIELRIFYIASVQVCTKNVSIDTFLDFVQKSIYNRFQSRSKVRNGQTRCIGTTFSQYFHENFEIIKIDDFCWFSCILCYFWLKIAVFSAKWFSKVDFFAMWDERLWTWPGSVKD